MSMLSSKTAQEISELLDEYGIKHGPVVGKKLGLFILWAVCQYCTSKVEIQPSPPSVSSSLFLILFLMCELLSSVLPDSTRSLYEKKLKEAMAKDRTPRNRPSSDKTYYREEGNCPGLLSFIDFQSKSRRELYFESFLATMMLAWLAYNYCL